MLAFGVLVATAGGEAAMCGYGWNHGWNGGWGGWGGGIVMSVLMLLLVVAVVVAIVFAVRYLAGGASLHHRAVQALRGGCRPKIDWPTVSRAARSTATSSGSGWPCCANTADRDEASSAIA